MPQRSPDSDSALLARVARKDRRAFEELYGRYHRRLYGYLARWLGRPERVEEVLNDVMFVVWTDARRFRRRSRVSTWILGIAYRKAMKALARDAREVTVAMPEPAAPAAETRRRELRLSLEKALAALSAEHRAVVELCFFEDLSYREIAAVVGCPVGTVKTRMFHARRRLREILPRLGFEAP